MPVPFSTRGSLPSHCFAKLMCLSMCLVSLFSWNIAATQKSVELFNLKYPDVRYMHGTEPCKAPLVAILLHTFSYIMCQAFGEPVEQQRERG